MTLLKDFTRQELKSGISYFAPRDICVAVDNKLVSQILQESGATRQNVRVCLHASPEDEFHSMLICERVASYFPPHRHLQKCETHQVLLGRLAVLTFDDLGKPRERFLLSQEEMLITRIPEKTWHLVSPRSSYVIYHEIKRGPFLLEGDREFASWAPGQGDDPLKYLRSLGLRS